eukprot:gene5886-7328_t
MDGGFVSVKCVPDAYIIQGVPYHRQETKYNCGDASLQMVFGYYGIDVNQLEIDNVARTSKKEGTSTYDIIRAAQFSSMSVAQGNVKPNHIDNKGYKGQRLGLNAVGYSTDYIWTDDLKVYLSLDIPVITLMHYSLQDPGGHFRVVIGFNETGEYFTTLDPWDRDSQPRVFNISYTDFATLWNYIEKDSPRGTPYFGALIYPMGIDTNYQLNPTNNTVDISATFYYNNIMPDSDTFPTGVMSLVSIGLPDGYYLVSPSQQSDIINGPINDGNSYNVVWSVQCPTSQCQGTFSVTAEVLINGSVPETYDKKQNYYASYNYMDLVGSTVQVVIQQ